MELIQYIIVGIGLSMDAFSLAILYGLFLKNKRLSLLLSSSVGIFHFIMPFLGSIIGSFYIAKYLTHPNHLVAVIFFLLAIEMIFSLKEEEKVSPINNIFHVLGFAFTVSLDSFSVGIGLGTTGDNIILAGFIFTLCSFFFTYIGLLLGEKIHHSFGKKANLFGCFLLFILSFVYFFE